MAAENTIKITTADFDGTIEKGVTLVDFWATWCGPCRMIAPMIDQLADENAGKAVVGKVDVDENPELAQRFKVMTIPTLIVFRDGEEMSRVVGARPKPQLQGLIDEALS
ncbi:MAG: thioredoxin [Christensenellales bacterium]|jgi:thioredoxin 1